jgi:DNA-directed RNA polymerase specialized sigma24 family protein
MPDAKPGPEWVLFSTGPESRSAPAPDSELVTAACAAWPKALAHARREFWRQGNEAEDASLATEVWEGVLQGVSKTLQRMNGRRSEINLEAYLLGTFYHRLGRAIRKEQRREETIHLVSSVRELEVLASASRAQREYDIESDVHGKELVERMDTWSHTIWVAREYGYSWNGIGRILGIPGDHVMRRFRRRMDILRTRLTGGR